MFKNLKLEKPIAFIDVETTGLSPTNDRIVELSVLKVQPDGSKSYHSHRINPEMHIPAEATAIHHITDADVADKPRFRQYAKSLLEFLQGCDIGGFNVIQFDVRFLQAEFKRAGMEFSTQGRRLVDSQIIYHKLEPRDITAAYQKYCGRQMENNHTAEGDATAAAEILDGQLAAHPELPKDVEGLCAFCSRGPENSIDPDGKFVWSGGEAVCNFGNKYKGQKLRVIATNDPDYLRWISRADFSAEVKSIASKALSGQFPSPPAE